MVDGAGAGRGSRGSCLSAAHAAGGRAGLQPGARRSPRRTAAAPCGKRTGLALHGPGARRPPGVPRVSPLWPAVQPLRFATGKVPRFLRGLHGQARFTFLSMERTEVWWSSERCSLHPFGTHGTPARAGGCRPAAGEACGWKGARRESLRFAPRSLPAWREGQTPAARLASRRGDARGHSLRGLLWRSQLSEVLIRGTSVLPGRAKDCREVVPEPALPPWPRPASVPVSTFQ